MSAEESSDLVAFARTGINLCRQDDWQRGLMYLRRVAELHPGANRLPPLFYAYLGYGVMRFDGRKDEGITLCRHAARKQFYHPEVQLNLARAELLVNNRPAAVRAVKVGLALDGEHPQLRQLQQSLGIRQSPPLAFLPRGHLLNRLLGRLRNAWLRRRMLGWRWTSRSADDLAASQVRI